MNHNQVLNRIYASDAQQLVSQQTSDSIKDFEGRVYSRRRQSMWFPLCCCLRLILFPAPGGGAARLTGLPVRQPRCKTEYLIDPLPSLDCSDSDTSVSPAETEMMRPQSLESRWQVSMAGDRDRRLNWIIFTMGETHLGAAEMWNIISCRCRSIARLYFIWPDIYRLNNTPQVSVTFYNRLMTSEQKSS